MAVSRVTCPECEAVLKLAQAVEAGKRIRCPECKNVITLTREMELAPEPKEEDAPRAKKPAPKGAVTKEAPRKGAAKPAAAPPPEATDANGDEKKGADDEEGGTYAFADADQKAAEEEARKKKKKKKRRDDDDDEDDEDEEKDPTALSYAPDMSIKDLRGPAVEALVQPTNKMILIGAIGFFGWLGLITLILIPFLFPLRSDEGDKDHPIAVKGIGKGLAGAADEADPPPPGDKDKKTDDSTGPLFVIGPVDVGRLGEYEWYVFIFILIFPLVLGALYSAIMVYGAVKAQSLESWGWGMASSIMGIIPISPFGFIAFTMFFLGIGLSLIFDPEDLEYILWGWLILPMLAQIAIGVWNLVVMLRAEVIEGFEYEPE
jgi:hypothetical protein